MSFWKKWVKPKPLELEFPEFTAELNPLVPLFVIGDVHGRIDLLDRMILAVPEDAQLIFVGDLIDRGDNSADVLMRVKECCENGAICLMGNHEKMMLDFFERPTERGPRWLRYGGLQVFQSYGVRGINERSGETDILAARDNLEEVMPDGMLEWVRNLPLYWSSGNVHVVHAAADPAVEMNEQNSRVLLWGTSAFSKRPRTDEQWVIHGHTIIDKAMSKNGRISVDTGAYATGVLSAVYIKPCGVLEFITT
jgi:serine/threonine protein phosphatase 1